MTGGERKALPVCSSLTASIPLPNSLSNTSRKVKYFQLRVKLKAASDALQMFVPDVHTFDPPGNIGVVSQGTAIPIAVLDECNIYFR